MYRLIVLFVLLASPGCAPPPGSTGNPYADAYNLGQAKVCPHIAAFAIVEAWQKQQHGVPMQDVLDAFDNYLATNPGFTQHNSRQVNRAIHVVYANPQWTKDQAYTGVEQDCRRTSMY